MIRVRRTLIILARLLPFVLAFVRDRRRWILVGRPAARSESEHARRADRLARTIAGLGPTFIKLAQIFSARADLMPEPYLSAVTRLQDRVPPEPADAVEEVIESELGRPVDALFERFEREPVAAASLGQVHRARVRDDGGGVEDVAVKVLRPGVEAVVAVDLDISFRVLFLLNVLFPNHHIRALTNAVREFSVRVQEEMDFRREAENIALFQRHFSADERVRAPRVRERFTRRRVLVMEWVAGDKIDGLDDRFATGDLEFERLMEMMTEVYLQMLLVEGVLHADPHPGNLLVEEDGTVVLLDWGMVVQLGAATREQLLRVALAAGRGDAGALINGMYELGMIDPDVSRAEVRDAAAEILEILDRARSLGIRRAQDMVGQIMDTFYTWPLVLPRELVYVFRIAVLLEGIGFRYDPEFNGLEVARAVVGRMRKELRRATIGEPVDVARDAIGEVETLLRAVRDVFRRAEREEFRVRIHPRDVAHAERFVRLQVRRILLSVFAAAIALISAIAFLRIGSLWLLAAGLLVAFILFIGVLVLPSHLLENPLRHARGLRPPSV